MVSQLKSDKAPSIGLVETPALKLTDPDGKNWTGEIQGTALVSKQILLSNLQAGEFDAKWIINCFTVWRSQVCILCI